MKLIGWGSTDTGRKRSHNEDSYLVDTSCRLFAVADGMGGHRGGATASRMAMDILHRRVSEAVDNLAAAADAILSRSWIGYETTEVARRDPTLLSPKTAQESGSNSTSADSQEFDSTLKFAGPPAISVMKSAAEEASSEIYDTALGDPKLRGMGTTLTAMLYDNGRMYLVHAGDSRAYLFRNNKLEQLTEDHTWIAEQVKSGMMTEEEANASKYRHVITRSVGFERNVDVATYGVAVEAGDCYLLCSDGVSNHITHDEIEQVLTNTWFSAAPQRLIELANDRGGDDNITVVIVHVANHAEEEEEEGKAAGQDP